MAKSQSLLLAAEGVSFSYNNVPLLVDRSLALQAGEIVHLTGSNGSGKTTFLSLLAGIVIPDEGVVTAHKNTHMVLSHEALESSYNVLEYNNFWNNNCSEYIFDIDAVKHLYCRELSQGWKQKIALNRLSALPQDAVWILDEPFAHLDAEAQAILSAAITTHAEQGGAVIFSTHMMLNSLKPTREYAV